MEEIGWCALFAIQLKKSAAKVKLDHFPLIGGEDKNLSETT